MPNRRKFQQKALNRDLGKRYWKSSASDVTLNSSLAGDNKVDVFEIMKSSHLLQWNADEMFVLILQDDGTWAIIAILFLFSDEEAVRLKS